MGWLYPLLVTAPLTLGAWSMFDRDSPSTFKSFLNWMVDDGGWMLAMVVYFFAYVGFNGMPYNPDAVQGYP